jgi:hypothetical protein
MSLEGSVSLSHRSRTLTTYYGLADLDNQKIADSTTAYQLDTCSYSFSL